MQTQQCPSDEPTRGHDASRRAEPKLSTRVHAREEMTIGVANLTVAMTFLEATSMRLVTLLYEPIGSDLSSLLAVSALVSAFTPQPPEASKSVSTAGLRIRGSEVRILPGAQKTMKSQPTLAFLLSGGSDRGPSLSHSVRVSHPKDLTGDEALVPLPAGHLA